MTDYADSATDTWLVARVAQQDEAKLHEALCKPRESGLRHGVACAALARPAEEVTQDVFLAAPGAGRER
ncbi:MAG: hypothetical protein R3A10_11380 [Caldilineaceae bacterium]